jgi:hypothetical protein
VVLFVREVKSWPALRGLGTPSACHGRFDTPVTRFEGAKPQLPRAQHFFHSIQTQHATSPQPSTPIAFHSSTLCCHQLQISSNKQTELGAKRVWARVVYLFMT